MHDCSLSHLSSIYGSRFMKDVLHFFSLNLLEVLLPLGPYIRLSLKRLPYIFAIILSLLFKINLMCSVS